MRRVALYLARALLVRCPVCGSRGIFASWFHMKPHCPRCNLALDRHESEDYFLGGMMFNIVLAELAFVTGLVIWLVASWPDPPWTLIEWVGIPFMVIAPIVFYPLSKTIWLAFDLAFRPPRLEEFESRNYDYKRGVPR
jgi:uncharacterized protein (DUF983 family)